jgi:chorismate mutase/prephenate dehydratase
MNDSDELRQIRECIDDLDRRIQELVNERARCAQQVARVKADAGEEASFYRPEREAAILREIQARNRGPLSDEEIARLFREIMSACLALEEKLEVAFLGPEGTFTQEAALKHFGHSVGTVPLASIDDVFREVASGAAHYGVVPVENSTEGVVSHTLDLFLQSTLRICGEVLLRIHDHLLVRAGGMQDIRRVYSHQQSFAQCREWLDTHLPHAERIAVSSNAEAARLASREAGAAAIAGDAAGRIYGFTALASNIEDDPDNTTRFLVIGRQEVPPCGQDKTTLLVSGSNRSGLLHDLLGPLARNGISMTRLESRPSGRGLWEYVFFIDIEGHVQDERVATAIAEMEQEASLLKVLGSYPRAVL